MRTLECEVGAGEAGLVRGVNNDAQIADESRSALLGGKEEVAIPRELFMSARCSSLMCSGKVVLLCGEAGSSHVSMLAGQVANLALERRVLVAGRALSGVVRVQVRTGGGAVVVGDGELVDVVHCEETRLVDCWRDVHTIRTLTERTSSCRKTRDGDLHVGAGTVGACLDNNSATDRSAILVGQLSDVLRAARVLLNDGSIACEG
jgi:hypothetical protein